MAPEISRCKVIQGEKEYAYRISEAVVLEDDLQSILESHEHHSGQGPFPYPRLFEESDVYGEGEVICLALSLLKLFVLVRVRWSQSTVFIL